MNIRAIINELKSLMLKFIEDGRNTPGTPKKMGKHYIIQNNMYKTIVKLLL